MVILGGTSVIASHESKFLSSASLQHWLTSSHVIWCWMRIMGRKMFWMTLHWQFIKSLLVTASSKILVHRSDQLWLTHDCAGRELEKQQQQQQNSHVEWHSWPECWMLSRITTRVQVTDYWPRSVDTHIKQFSWVVNERMRISICSVNVKCSALYIAFSSSIHLV